MTLGEVPSNKMEQTMNYDINNCMEIGLFGIYLK